MLANIASIEIPSLSQSLVDWLKGETDARLAALGLARDEIDERAFYPRLALGEYLAAQFVALVSQARGIFAFNSVNVEGWGLYSEWVMFPYMPDDAKLISLQLRLLRAARAYLDPELQQGKIAPAQAMQVLEKDVVLSEAFATEEVDRFTFRSPGQAVSYFDGYLRMRALRTDTEKAMGEKFNQRKFHDFILDQGMLPPNVLRKAVMAEYVGGGN